jgi:hypothetical protein
MEFLVSLSGVDTRPIWRILTLNLGLWSLDFLFLPDEAEHDEQRAFESGLTTARVEPFL